LEGSPPKTEEEAAAAAEEELLVPSTTDTTDGAIIQKVQLLLTFYVVFPKPKGARLFASASIGEIEELKGLLASPSIDVNFALESTGDTSLHRACENGHRSAVEQLLKHPKTDPNLTNQAGNTPLHCACEARTREIVALLLEDPRVDVNKVNSAGLTPLFAAASQGRMDIVGTLMTSEKVDVNKAVDSRSGKSALYVAGERGWFGIAQYLLAFEGTVDTKRKSLVGQVTATEMARSYVTAVRREGDNDEEFMRTKVFGYLIANLIDFYDWDPAMTRATLRKQLNLKDLISAPPLMPALPMPIPQAKQKGNPSLPPSLFLVQVLTLFWLGKKKRF